MHLLLGTTAALGLLSGLAQAAPHAGKMQHRHAVALAKPELQAQGATGAAAEGTNHTLARRDYGRMTFFDVDGATDNVLGACGGMSHNDEFVAALNEAQWAGGSHCSEWVTIEYNGKQVSVQIRDQCPYSGGCESGGELDLSPAAFEALTGNKDLGLVYATWWFGSGQAETTSTSEWVAPTTTSENLWWTWPGATSSSTPEWTPEPTSTWVPPPTSTSQWVAPTTTSMSTTTSTSTTTTTSTSTSTTTTISTSTSTSSSSSGFSSSYAAAPTTTVVEVAQQLVLAYGNLAQAALAIHL